MTKWKIYNEDAVEWAKNYQKGKFHALLCDAPYHLTSITKRFGKNGSAPAKFGSDGAFQRASKGFMGTQWDGGDIAFRPETWEAFQEVLYPGAFGMAFSASRNWHRMAVAIEDAGFIIHPTMFFLWIQGQGFPKATRVKGHEEFEGHRYGLQALKPSVEPIIVFQKPYEGKPVDNIVFTGAGALNIDDARIPTQDEYVINQFDDGMKPFGNGAGHSYTSKPSRKHKGKVYDGVAEGYKRPNASMYQHKTDWEMQDGGRWPSNLILDEVSAEKLDAQTGVLTSGKLRAEVQKGSFGHNGIYSRSEGGNDGKDYDSTSGGASRFFYQVSTQLDEADPFLYQSKVSPKERNSGLDELEDIKMAVSGGAQGADGRGKEEYLQDSIGLNRIKVVKNGHPTLKPINLAKYLATLLLPPVEYAPRRIFIPFSGSGSEMIGAGLAGWEHVVGVEFDTENNYVEIAKKRLEHWLP